MHWCWRNTKKTFQISSLKYFQILVDTFTITYNGIFGVELVWNTLFKNNFTGKFIICDRFHWCWRETKNAPQTSSQEYFIIVVETFPITFNVFFCVASVWNTLFYNKYNIKQIICDRLHCCEENPKIRPKHLFLNISISWWRPSLSHIMVFFVLNKCGILFFTIILQENSLYVIACIGVGEKPKIRAKYLAWNISKSWWRPFLSHIMVFFV